MFRGFGLQYTMQFFLLLFYDCKKACGANIFLTKKPQAGDACGGALRHFSGTIWTSLWRLIQTRTILTPLKLKSSATFLHWRRKARCLFLSPGAPMQFSWPAITNTLDLWPLTETPMLYLKLRIVEISVFSAMVPSRPAWVIGSTYSTL